MDESEVRVAAAREGGDGWRNVLVKEVAIPSSRKI